jgi:hypothetical protein
MRLHSDAQRRRKFSSQLFLFPFSNLVVFTYRVRHSQPDILLFFTLPVANPCHFELFFPNGNLLRYECPSSFLPVILLSWGDNAILSWNIVVTFYMNHHIYMKFSYISHRCFIFFYLTVMLWLEFNSVVESPFQNLMAVELVEKFSFSTEPERSWKYCKEIRAILATELNHVRMETQYFSKIRFVSVICIKVGYSLQVVLPQCFTYF